MSLTIPPILRLSQDCLNGVFELLSASELTLLYFSGDNLFRTRMFSKGAITTLLVSNDTRERKLIQRFPHFPTKRGELKCKDGLDLPIVFQLPYLTTYIERRIPTTRNWPEHASHPCCLFALPPTLTHLESDWSQLLRRLHRHDYYQQDKFDVLKDPYSADGILSIRALFPGLRTLILEDATTRLANERYDLYARAHSLVSAFKAVNALNRWDLPDTESLYPPSLTVFHAPLRLYLDVPALPSIPSHLTSLKLIFDSPSSSSTATAPLPYFLRVQDPADGEITPEVDSNEAKNARILENYHQTFSGVVSLHTWHANPKVLSIFTNLTELHTTSIRDTVTARYLPKTLTTFSTSFDPSRSSPSPPIVNSSNFDTYGWVSIVESLPRGITRLELYNVVPDQAMRFSRRVLVGGHFCSEDDDDLMDIKAFSSWPNPFPPNLRSLTIKFMNSSATRHHIKELGNCSLSRLLPTMESLEEVCLERVNFRFLGRFPRLARLSLDWCTGETFTKDHWRLFPQLTELKVFRMRDSALLENQNEISKNLAMVYATELSATGSLLKRHGYPIQSVTPKLLLDDLKSVQTPYSVSWHDFCVRALQFLPPSLTGRLKAGICISLDLILPLLDPSSDERDIANGQLPSKMSALTLQYERSLREEPELAERILQLMGWKSVQWPGTNWNHLPIRLPSLLLLPSSITQLYCGKLFFNVDTELELIAQHWDSRRPLELGRSSIMSAVARMVRPKLRLELHTNRMLKDHDLNFFPRDNESVSVDSAYTDFTCEALTRHFHRLTSLKFDQDFSGMLSSLSHMVTLTHITYPLRSTNAQLGVSLLPPSITSLVLLGSNWTPDDASGIRNLEGISNIPTLPWPTALRSLRVYGSLPSLVHALPKNQLDFQELELTDRYSISFGTDLVKHLPRTLTSLIIHSYSLSERCLPHLPPNLIKLKVLGGALDNRVALEYLAERRAVAAKS